MKRMFLVDGSHQAFRVQFGAPPRHATDGFPTRVLYGFTLLFQAMLRTWRPDYVAVSFDTGATFRNDLFPDYKGHRPEMPEDLARQWPLLPELVEGFGYRCINVDGFEADDVLGTLAKRFASEDVEVMLVTGDKDFCQLVEPNIRILDERKNEVIGPDEVVARFGVPPDKVIDILGLAGDTSDNIPGVHGVGVKTATKYVNDWGSLEGALAAAAAGRIKGKTGQRMVDEADAAKLSKVLATIRTDVPLDLTLEDLAPSGVKEEPLRELFDRLEFGLVARKLLPHRDAVDRSGWRVVTDPDDLDALADVLRRAGRFGVHADGRPAKGLAFCWSATDVVYVPFDHEEASFSADEALDALRPVLEDAAVLKTGHDLKATVHALADRSVTLAGIDGDTVLLDYVLASHRKTHGLDDLASRHLGHTLAQPVMEPEDLDDAAGDAQEAVQVSWLAERKLVRRLDAGPERVYREIELPLLPVLARMEQAGIRLDLMQLAAVERDIGARVDALEARCHEVAGKTFNLRSRHELRDILFTELGLTPSKKVSDGWSTDSSVLEKLVGEHPLVEAILEYRSMEKLRGTYLSKLPAYVGGDGRIHSSFNQAVAATGRLSSADPNLQNIPVRTFEGRRIREAFVPERGYHFLSADYSQIELRILAHYCGDEVLLDAFRTGQDIHTRTASEVFGVSPEEVTIELRSAAKAINFGLIYGMSAFRLAGDLAISQSDAQRYVDEYFGRMPKVQGWLESVREAVRRDGHVETLFGRRRVIPEVYSTQYNERMAGEREAVNTPIQGTAADLIKLAMLSVDEGLRDSGLDARMVLQVHDELLVEVRADQVDAVRELLVARMEGVADLQAPLVVNTSVGDNWNEAHG